VTSQLPVISCSWPFRWPMSPPRQSWQIGMSGCERNLTHQSTEVEQQTQVAGIIAMVRGGRPALHEGRMSASGPSYGVKNDQ
jgi:hypothetical protein